MKVFLIKYLITYLIFQSILISRSENNIFLKIHNTNIEIFKNSSLARLNEKKIRNIRLPVSAPFHCKLMDKATSIMRDKIKAVSIPIMKIEIKMPCSHAENWPKFDGLPLP